MKKLFIIISLILTTILIIFALFTLVKSLESIQDVFVPSIPNKNETIIYGYKYSNYKDTESMVKLHNFGKKCRNCRKEMTADESKKPIGLCNKCEIT